MSEQRGRGWCSPAHANRCHSESSVRRSEPNAHSPNCAPQAHAFLAAAFLGAAFLAAGLALGAAFLAALGLAAAFTLVAVFFTCWSRGAGEGRSVMCGVWGMGRGRVIPYSICGAWGGACGWAKAVCARCQACNTHAPLLPNTPLSQQPQHTLGVALAFFSPLGLVAFCANKIGRRGGVSQRVGGRRGGQRWGSWRQQRRAVPSRQMDCAVPALQLTSMTVYRGARPS